MWKRVVVAMVVALAGATVASAQATSSGQTPSTPAGSTASQPAAGKFGGDGRHPPGDDDLHGGHRVSGSSRPARCCRPKRWSVSAYRVNYDYNQGFTDVSNWPLTFGVRPRRSGGGLRRVDAGPPHRPRRPSDLPPVAAGSGRRRRTTTRSCARAGRATSSATCGWAPRSTCSSEYHQQPRWRSPSAAWSSCRPRSTTTRVSAPARRTSRSTPSSARKSTSGSSCPGSAASSSAATRTTFDLSNGFRWGFGAGFPTRKHLRLTAELHGERYFDDTDHLHRHRLIGEDGSLPPSVTHDQLAGECDARTDLAGEQRGSPAPASTGT